MAKKPNKSELSLERFLLDLLLDVVIVVALVLLIRAFLFAPFKVNGPSMCDTLNDYDGVCLDTDGELIVTSRLATWSLFGWSPGSIERGDVVVFSDPYDTGREYLVKRVIGVGGDTIKIEGGLVYLMDVTGEFVQIEEPYLNEENQGNTYTHSGEVEIYEVPEDAYFVMGDNRRKSLDSRRCFGQTGCMDNSSPFIAHEYIEGEVKLVLLPVTHFRWISGFDYGL